MPQTVLLVDDSNTVRTAAEMVSAKGDFHLVTAADEAGVPTPTSNHPLCWWWIAR